MATKITLACLVCIILVAVFGPGESRKIGTVSKETRNVTARVKFRWVTGTFYPYV